MEASRPTSVDFETSTRSAHKIFWGIFSKHWLLKVRRLQASKEDPGNAPPMRVRSHRFPSKLLCQWWIFAVGIFSGFAVGICRRCRDSWATLHSERQCNVRDWARGSHYCHNWNAVMWGRIILQLPLLSFSSPSLISFQTVHFNRCASANLLSIQSLLQLIQPPIWFLRFYPNRFIRRGFKCLMVSHSFPPLLACKTYFFGWPRHPHPRARAASFLIAEGARWLMVEEGEQQEARNHGELGNCWVYCTVVQHWWKFFGQQHVNTLTYRSSPNLWSGCGKAMPAMLQRRPRACLLATLVILSVFLFFFKRSFAILPLPPWRGGGAKWQSFVGKLVFFQHSLSVYSVKMRHTFGSLTSLRTMIVLQSAFFSLSQSQLSKFADLSLRWQWGCEFVLAA